MAKKSNRREQTPKNPDRDRAKMFQELRRSNATVPIPSGKAYTRKNKYKEF